MRPIRAILVAVLVPLVLFACAAQPPVNVPQPAQVPQAQVRSQSESLRVLLEELHTQYLIGGGAQYISADATPALAAAELDQAIGLGSQAIRFALATASELTRDPAAGSIAEVTFDLRDVEVLGELDGRVIAATTIWQRVRPEQGSITEQEVTYAVGWEGEELVSVEELRTIGGEQGLDSGVGLSSPTGAVYRFVDLVQQRDFDAVRELSRGQNTNETTLEVLASVVDSSEEVFAVSLPQHSAGTLHVVYLVNAVDLVVGRFEVRLSDPTQVVFIPTS